MAHVLDILDLWNRRWRRNYHCAIHYCKCESTRWTCRLWRYLCRHTTWVQNTAGLGLIHESQSIHNHTDFTRSWFAWVNSYFAEMMLDLAERKPALIFKNNTSYVIGQANHQTWMVQWVKHSHSLTFQEFWYTIQTNKPPASYLLAPLSDDWLSVLLEVDMSYIFAKWSNTENRCTCHSSALIHNWWNVPRLARILPPSHAP